MERVRSYKIENDSKIGFRIRQTGMLACCQNSVTTKAITKIVRLLRQRLRQTKKETERTRASQTRRDRLTRQTDRHVISHAGR